MIDPRVSAQIAKLQSAIDTSFTKLYNRTVRGENTKELKEALVSVKIELRNAIDSVVELEDGIMLSAYDESCNRALLTMALSIQDFCDAMTEANTYAASVGNHAWTPSLMTDPGADVHLSGVNNLSLTMFITGVKDMLGKDPSKRIELPAEYNEDGDYD